MVTEIFGVKLGERPTARAFQKGGELEIERGRREGDHYVPFKAPILYPLDPASFTFAYEKESAYLWRDVNAHYTPVSRVRDYIEVWDYFSTQRVKERDVREKYLPLLSAAVARQFPDGRIRATARFIRYAEQYVVVTRIEDVALVAAARKEYAMSIR